MPYKKGYFKDKKITVMGLGLLGRGVGDVKFLAKEGAELLVTDKKSKEELAPSLEQLGDFKNITYRFGERHLEDFKNRDFILKAAGVPLDSPYIEEAKKHHIPIEMSTSLFAELSTTTLVGVTGTRGKSTVTHLLFEVLQRAAKEVPKFHSRKIFLGGNVKGISTLAYLPQVSKDDYAVLELDSWQLQGFGDKKISPHISIFTTFYPDHLDYYKDDMAKYLDDKANIFKFQSKQDFLIIGAQVVKLLEEKYNKKIKAQKIVIDENYFPKDWQLNILGTHNRYNAALALTAARILEVPDEISQKVFENFRGVSGRLEYITEINGVKVYNDTTATTPEATLAGLNALSNKRNLVLIMGGTDKQLDMTKLIEAIPLYTRAVILLPGTGSSRIKSELEFRQDVKFHEAENLDIAVSQALKQARLGDVLLFSPAFASFGQFKNEFDRGEQFNKIFIKN